MSATAEYLEPSYDPMPQDGDEGFEVQAQLVSQDALATINRSEIAQQIEIARKYPRNVEKLLKKLDAMVTINQPIALSMFYTLPRGRKQIIGPGVRFAETLLTNWGNARSAVRLIGAQGGFFVSQGAFFDCETNVGISIEAQRRITDSEGHRYNDDMIGNTGNAAASIAYRNAIFRGIPKALWLPSYERARACAIGNIKSMAEAIREAMEVFTKSGVTEYQVLNTLNLPSLREVTGDHLLTLRALWKEISSSDKTIESVFGAPEDAEIETLMEQLNWNGPKQRMAWNEYKGRRGDLLLYMRGEVGKIDATTTVGNGKAAPVQQPQTQTEQVSKQQVEAEEQKGVTDKKPEAQTQQTTVTEALKGVGQPKTNGNGAPKQNKANLF